MPYRDLREYIAKLESYGEVQTIDCEVAWNLEVGAVIRRSYDLKAPAPMFTNIAGYGRQYRVFGAPVGLSSKPGALFARLAVAMDLPPETGIEGIIKEYIRRKANLLPPVLIDTAPCKEEIHLGNDANLLEFPAPMLHHGDGGRYIGTWHTIVTKDPDTGWVNWGMYRLMVHDEQTMGGILSKNKHIGFHFYPKYEARGNPMEFAVAIGTEPVTALVSGSRVPAGINEASVAGALRGEPVELVRCETVDLEVPASAEIVIEGHVVPGERIEEGPFGEYTGFRAGDRAPRPVYKVIAITHRRNPILTACCVGVPVDDSAVRTCMTKAAEALEDLQKRGFPVKSAYCPPFGVGHTLYVSTAVPYYGYVKQLVHALWGGNIPFFQTVVLPEDVDVTNHDEVLWSLATRCHPVRDVYQTGEVLGNPLLPFLSTADKQLSRGAYIAFNCTWPIEWKPDQIPEKASLDAMWPKSMQEKVLSRWLEYGYQASG